MTDDADGDGFAGDDDCDDSDPDIHPDADEVCDTVDNNCDGVIDEDSAVDAPAWYPDSDGDGYGATAGGVVSCSAPEGYIDSGGDSDDGNTAVYPGAIELCDGVQNDSDAASWTAADEAGVATFVAPDGSITDWTSLLSGEVTIAESGALRVCEGTWVVRLEVTADDVSITGSGEGITVLDGGGLAVVIVADAISGLAVDALTITNGYGSTSGGGLFLAGVSATLTNITVSDNIADSWGAGVFVYSGSDVTLQEVTIADNTAQSGGGLFIYGGSVTLIDSVIDGNTADYGGGIYASAGSSATLTNTTIAGNTAAHLNGPLVVANGGGLFLSESSATLTDSTVSGNDALEGGGLYLSESSVSVVNTDFQDNVEEDVHLEETATDYSWGLGVSFTCDTAGCG